MTTTQKLIQPKIGLLKLAEKLGTVQKPAKLWAIQETAFTVFQKLYEEGEKKSAAVNRYSKTVLNLLHANTKGSYPQR